VRVGIAVGGSVAPGGSVGGGPSGGGSARAASSSFVKLGVPIKIISYMYATINIYYLSILKQNIRKPKIIYL
jgi:hypothetical protein